MNEGKQKILNMLEAGIISQEDAYRLLEALGEETEFPEKQQADAPPEQREESGGVPSLTLYPEGMEEKLEKVFAEADAPEAPPAPEIPEIPETPPIPQASSIPFVSESSPAEQTGVETPHEYPGLGSAIRSLDVEWMSGSVEVFYGEGDQVKVAEYAKRPLSDGEKMEVSMVNGSLRIAWSKSHIRWPFFKSVAKRLVVELPKTGSPLETVDIGVVSASISLNGLMANSLSAHTVSGEISAFGLQGRRIGLSSTSGRIDARTLSAEELKLSTVSGKLTGDFSAVNAGISSTSGKIELRGDAAGTLKLSSVSGSVRFEGTAGGSVKAKTTSGSSCLALGTMPESLQSSSVSGSVTLLLPDTAEGFSAEYHTVSGGFDCDFPVTGTREKRSGSLRCGMGKTRIDLSTTSGSMRIEKS